MYGAVRKFFLTLSYERCCVTKIRFVGFVWVRNGFALKVKKIVYFVNKIYPDFVFHSLLLASCSGRSNAISASYRYFGFHCRQNRVRTT